MHVDFGDADVVQIDPTSEEEERPRRETQFFRDLTKTIIARNDSEVANFIPVSSGVIFGTVADAESDVCTSPPLNSNPSIG